MPAPDHRFLQASDDVLLEGRLVRAFLRGKRNRLASHTWKGLVEEPTAATGRAIHVLYVTNNYGIERTTTVIEM